MDRLHPLFRHAHLLVGVAAPDVTAAPVLAVEKNVEPPVVVMVGAVVAVMHVLARPMMVGVLVVNVSPSSKPSSSIIKEGMAGGEGGGGGGGGGIDDLGIGCVICSDGGGSGGGGGMAGVLVVPSIKGTAGTGVAA